MGTVRSVTVVQQDDYHFIGIAGSHRVSVDLPTSVDEGQGPTPKELLLVGIGACAGSNLNNILHKSRIPVAEIRIQVGGTVTEPGIHPGKFTSFRMDYFLSGEGMERRAESVVRFVVLSQEKYCSMVAMARLIAPVAWTLHINGVAVASGSSTDAP